MVVERRGSVRPSLSSAQLTISQEEAEIKTKQFNISKWQVVNAYKLVKANAGAAGVDNETLADFDQELKRKSL